MENSFQLNNKKKEKQRQRITTIFRRLTNKIHKTPKPQNPNKMKINKKEEFNCVFLSVFIRFNPSARESITIFSKRLSLLHILPICNID